MASGCELSVAPSRPQQEQLWTQKRRQVSRPGTSVNAPGRRSGCSAGVAAAAFFRPVLGLDLLRVAFGAHGQGRARRLLEHRLFGRNEGFRPLFFDLREQLLGRLDPDPDVAVAGEPRPSRDQPAQRGGRNVPLED